MTNFIIRQIYGDFCTFLLGGLKLSMLDDYLGQKQLAEDKENYLEHPIPAAPVAAPGQQVLPQALAAHAAREQELLQTVGEFHACKQEEGQSVSSYVLKMKSYIDDLEHLGQPMSLRLVVSLILVSLSKDYDGFVQNYAAKERCYTCASCNKSRKGQEKPKEEIAQGCLGESRERSLEKELSLLSCRFLKIRSYLKELALQGLKGSRKLQPGALSLYVGDGHRTAVEAIEEFYFNKRAKLNLDFSLLWHCRLGHISKKRIEKLQDDELLNSTDIKSFEKCVSCMSEKMARKPYSHQVKRAKDLLGLIHTDSVSKGSRKPTRELSHYVLIMESTRTCRAPDRMCLHVDVEEHELGDLGKPANYKASLLDPESDKWLNAMNVEMQSMKDNEVWDLVDLPPNGKAIGSKWLFKKNANMDGAIHTYRARVVAKGFTQTYRVNYEETFSLVADIRAIRILIAIAAFYDYEIWKMDVKTAFLNGHLSKKVYMVQPEASGSYVTFLILYVDDIFIMGNNIPMLQDVNSYLRRCFAMKDLGEAAYILGIKIYREKLKLSKSQGASTPAEKQRMQNVPYASAVRSIMYDVRCTHPDVAFAHNITSRFQQNPGELYWTTVKNILKYLRNTKDMFLVYEGDMKRELRVSCYTDAGYLMDADDLKSQTGYVFVLNGGVVDWKSTKQSIFTTSSTEAGYIAAYDASKEAIWIRKFIYGLGIVPTIEEPIKMYCDNTGSIAIAKESGITKGARHYQAKVYYLREVIEYGDVKIEKVHTDDNLDDPFTKALHILSILN
nr:hypothetical protein [Tanacetum cinerariifolium]